jgi:hypothetical protein
MSNDDSKLTRKGLHRSFHISKRDTYISGALSLLFLFLVIFKFFNRILDWEIPTRFISWQDSLQIALLWGIFAVISDLYYRKYEAKYDN